MRTVALILLAAFALSSCAMESEPASQVIPVADAAAAASLMDADPAIRNVMDLTFAEPRRYAIDLRCADQDRMPECAAKAAVRAAAWIRQHGANAEELLINVDAPDGGIGFQLYGVIPSSDALVDLTYADALERFSWNGGSYDGKDAAARWCLLEDKNAPFCQAFVSDACSPVAPPDTIKLCRSVGRS